MKYYKLKMGASNYEYYEIGVVYPEDTNPRQAVKLLDLLKKYPNDWEEINLSFKFGR